MAIIGEDQKISFANKYTGDPVSSDNINEIKQKHNEVVEGTAGVKESLVQLEQDVDVIRGDVQGVSAEGYADGIDWSGDFTIECWFRFKRAKGAGSYINVFSSNNEHGIKAQTRLTIYNDSIFSFYYGGITSDFRPPTKAIKVGDVNHVVCVRRGITNYFYANGVLIGSIDLQDVALGDKLYINSGYIDLFHIRKLNTAINHQHIEMLYNQMRCNDVPLGDEWRKEEVINTFNDNISANKTIITKQSDNHLSCVCEKNSTAGIYRWLFPSSVELAGIYYTFEVKLNQLGLQYNSSSGSVFSGGLDLTDTTNWQKLSGFLNQNSLVLYFNTTNIASDSQPCFEVRGLTLKNAVLTNEYLPKYLTKTKWIDTGVNKQDIELTAPTFTYVKPYKQLEVADVAPTANPVAAGCFYVNKAAKKVYISTK